MDDVAAAPDMDVDVDELKRRIAKLERDLDLLIRCANWVVWSAIVRAPTEERPWFDWDFRPDFTQIVPPWLDIEPNPGEWLAWTFTRLRIKEDNDDCDRRAKKALLAGGSGYNQTFRLRTRDGGVCWVEETVTIYPYTPGHWFLIGVCIDANDRMNREARMRELQEQLLARNAQLVERDRLQQERLALLEANARLEDLALTDELTGVRNLRGYRERLQAIWQASQERGTALSLIALDIDDFKQFNDRFGHPAGDRVLQQVGAILRDTARVGDCIARAGGEEFAVLLPGVRTVGAIGIAERFRCAIEGAAWPLRAITASLGVATALRPGGSFESLIEAADKALYRAKATGRNRVCHAAHMSTRSKRGSTHAAVARIASPIQS